jgi:hypothetical protein
MPDVLQHAIEYDARGWVVHPLTSPNSKKKSPGKRPILDGWQKLKGHQGINTLKEYFENKDRNIGLVCGKESGLTVIDADSLLFLKDLLLIGDFNTLRSKRTEGRGHIYFNYNTKLKSQKHHDLGIEILNDGNNAVMPPSIHVSGDVYQWINPDIDIIDVPDELENALLNLFLLESELKGILRKCRHCFRNVIKDKPNVHGAEGREYMLAVCTDLKRNGATDTHLRMFAKILYQFDYDADITNREMSNIDPERTWRCDVLKSKLSMYIDVDDCENCEIRRKEYQASIENKTCNTKTNTITKKNEIEYPPDILEIAKWLLEKGDSLNFILDTWNKKHVGDWGVGAGCAAAVASTHISNTSGIHIKPSGQSGKGKSDGAKKFLQLLPDHKKLSGSLSGKAIFYLDSLASGTIIFSDDTKLNEDIISTIKQATTNYQEDTVHNTVTIQRKGISLVIPKRISWWLTTVNSFDDDQMSNRFLTVDVDSDPTQDEAVFNKQVEMELAGVSDTDVDGEMMICKAMYDMLSKDEYRIVVPFVDCIIWNNMSNRRNFPMFLDIVRSVTFYYIKQRDVVNGMYLSTLSDFLFAKKIYKEIAETNTTNLTEIELKIMRQLGSVDNIGLELRTIANYIELGETATRNYIHGRDNNGGLLLKVPGLSCEKATVASGDKSTQKNFYYYNSQKFGMESYDDVVGIEYTKVDNAIKSFTDTHDIPTTTIDTTRDTLTTHTPLTHPMCERYSNTVDRISITHTYINKMYDKECIKNMDKNSHISIRKPATCESDDPDSENACVSDVRAVRAMSQTPEANVRASIDNETSDKKKPIQCIDARLPHGGQKALARHLKEFVNANYKSGVVGNFAEFIGEFMKAHDIYKPYMGTVIAFAEKMKERGWK